MNAQPEAQSEVHPKQVQRTQRPYAMAFAWGGIWLVLLTLGFTAAYGNFSAEGFGRFLAMTMLASAVTGFQGKRSTNAWDFWKVGVVFILALIGVWLISSYGAMQHH